MTDQRFDQLRQWAELKLGHGCEIKALAGDASFRRYFRVTRGLEEFVLMDAPPEKESVASFLAVRGWLKEASVKVPDLVHEDQEQGFLLLEDFGDMTWASSLESANKTLTLDQLFENALSQLRYLQHSMPSFPLPTFNVRRMQQECDLYLDWYLPRVAEYEPTPEQRQDFHAAMLPLLEEISALPQTPVHLDFHSRNLMLPAGSLPLGVIDFQDAVIGPVTYDLASLLYDCYQKYSEAVRREQSQLFFEGLPEYLRLAFDGFETWHRALRLTAMQRHIKAIGIFSRLAYRDGKLQFLDEIPLTRQHLQEEMKELCVTAPGLMLLAIEPRSLSDL